MAQVEYKWSDRSKPDKCEMVMYFTRREALCYHCGKKIPAQRDAVLLLTDREERFILHETCADKSCKRIENER